MILSDFYFNKTISSQNVETSKMFTSIHFYWNQFDKEVDRQTKSSINSKIFFFSKVWVLEMCVANRVFFNLKDVSNNYILNLHFIKQVVSPLRSVHQALTHFS